MNQNLTRNYEVWNNMGNIVHEGTDESAAHDVYDALLETDDCARLVEFSTWPCERKTRTGTCGETVSRHRGQSDVDCPKCGACYNASGQRLNDNWRDNRSNWDENVGDLEGDHEASLRRGGEL